MKNAAMKIDCVGGGPGGLYFAILMQKAFPGAEITLYEQNRADDAFGWAAWTRRVSAALQTETR